MLGNIQTKFSTLIVNIHIEFELVYTMANKRGKKGLSKSDSINCEFLLTCCFVFVLTVFPGLQNQNLYQDAGAS